MKSLNTQIGGEHYKSLAIQPAEYAQRNHLGFIEGCVVKYVTRHRIAKPADPLARIKSTETFNDLKSALIAWLEKEGK